MSGARDAEVAQLYAPILSNERVVWRYIPVDDVESSSRRSTRTVRVGETPRDLPQDPASDVYWKLLLPPLQLPHHVAERAAHDQLHRHKQNVTIAPKIESLDAVWTTDVSRDARFIHEHRGELVVLHQMRQDSLQRDDFFKASFSRDPCDPYRSHAA